MKLLIAGLERFSQRTIITTAIAKVAMMVLVMSRFKYKTSCFDNISISPAESVCSLSDFALFSVLFSLLFETDSFALLR